MKTRVRWRRRKNGTKPEEGPKSGAKLCAIYTRKSTEENLDQAFNSLDSQREYCKSFIKSREAEGWKAHPKDYTDPGFSGGNMDRPGLKALLADARLGKFQVVICYKYDRLSRNTRDFLEILDTFDRHGVAFVSVTQPIDTTSSVGRLMRSILMDFAQFEREMISERTRDKIAAMAKMGKWFGCHPVLGYDIDYDKKTLVPNKKEARQVKEMFATYIRTRSLSVAAKELNAKGYRMKAWTSKTSKTAKGGRRFNKCSLFYLLTNPVFIGKVRYKDKLFEGEHPAIIDADVFERVNKLLEGNGNGKAHQPRRRDVGHNYLLQGLLKCACCGYAMTPNYANSRGKKFFYYKCLPVVKLDKTACKVRSAPAAKLDQLVVDRLSFLGREPAAIAEIVKTFRANTNEDLPQKVQEKALLAAELGKVESQAANLVTILAEEGPESERKSFVLDQLEKLTTKKEELKARQEKAARELQALEERRIEADTVANNLRSFSRVFNKVTPKEQKELVQLMVKEAIYDGARNTLKLVLRALPSIGWDVNGGGAVLIPVKNGSGGWIRTSNPSVTSAPGFHRGLDYLITRVGCRALPPD